MYSLTCLRCGFVWESPKVRPSHCKSCESKVWDTPRKKANAQKTFSVLIEIETDECIVWPLSVIHDGYGRLRQGERTIQTHRLAYEKRIGPIPEGMCVLHHCDNPPCMNYKHLFLGTVIDNNEDKRQKKRHLFGEKHPLHKLTEESVREIRAKYIRDLSDRDKRQLWLAEEFGVDKSVISAIIRRKIWKHVQ